MNHVQNQSSPLPKLAVITAIFGEIDAPKSFPDQAAPHPFDYICITDNDCPCPFATLNARMKARYFKVQAHKIFPGYDAFIWMDGNIQIKNSTFVAEMMAALQEASIAIARHPSRDCIYDEAKFVTDGIRNGSNYLSARYDPVSISWQVAEYSNAGHPAHFGLWWCGLFARRVNERVNRFFDRWWNECLCWSNNDQISFAYLAERLNLEINSIAWGDFNENATYKRHHHLLVQ